MLERPLVTDIHDIASITAALEATAVVEIENEDAKSFDDA